MSGSEPTTETLRYASGDLACAGTLVIGPRADRSSPLLLVSPNWLGTTPEAASRAARIAGERGVALVADMYGGGRTATGPEDAGPLAEALRRNPTERRRRITAALDALTAEAARRGLGDSAKRAAIGFCFGGGNVLELARTSAEIRAAISLHGDLTSPMPAAPGTLRAALLVLHGSRDPVAPKAERDAFEAEMDAAGANWRMMTFGGLVHSFCEEDATVPGIAEYNDAAARASYRMVDDFLAEAFAA
ncbi:dienelactone hydrolase family protein [Roseomonas sp. KE2513]|uniref:dienelactone hydrolase family protein n=1 Tax=Roseomonas sp. KE2513 TaxID=2479202 RepID=UPI0018DF2AFF|nr:dienelactone hydrolase family protein [Roseomonas sp. KE2513]MBI0535775.1 dienelactone hydrolase family protein [Roseomonas sp. KE2513]